MPHIAEALSRRNLDRAGYVFSPPINGCVNIVRILAKWYSCIAAAFAGGWIQMGRMRSLSTGDLCADTAEATMGTAWNENGRIRFQASSILISVSPAFIYPTILPFFGVAAYCTHFAVR